MGDFYYKVKKAVENGGTKELLRDHGGDKRLKLAVSPRRVSIKKEAAFKTINNGKGSLEYIFCSAGCRNVEIPYTWKDRSSGQKDWTYE